LHSADQIPETGMLIYTEFLYKPMMKPFSAGFRWQYSQSDSYNSRLYAYENDVLYRFSIPTFYGKNRRYYLNLEYQLSEACAFWLRWSESISDVDSNQSVDQASYLHGSRDLHLQLVLKFK